MKTAIDFELLKVPSPFPSSTVYPKGFSANRSGIPSSLKSPTRRDLRRCSRGERRLCREGSIAISKKDLHIVVVLVWNYQVGMTIVVQVSYLDVARKISRSKGPAWRERTVAISK